MKMSSKGAMGKSNKESKETKENKRSGYLDANQAADTLGVNRATLYAYVSRGLIRSELSEDGRARWYRREDIEALTQRKEMRRNPTRVAENALLFGAPVMESSISLIANNALYYRGQNAVTLAAENSIEEVAALIWFESLTTPFPEVRSQPSQRWLTIAQILKDLSLPEAFQILIPLAASEDIASYDTKPKSVASTGAQILRLMAAIVAQGNFSAEPIAEQLRKAWKVAHTQATHLLNAALILCADHELNASAFTARCVASTGANPYGAVTAALAALQGHRHGGECDRVEGLFNEAQNPDRAQLCLIDRLRRGDRISGFHHPLYPEGDPRGAMLLRLAAEIAPNSPGVLLSKALVKAMFELTGLYPTVDTGLVTLSRALALPDRAAITLFAMGRVVGWIGHAIEQYQLDRLIRPRANYIGVQPVENASPVKAPSNNRKKR